VDGRSNVLCVCVCVFPGLCLFSLLPAAFPSFLLSLSFILLELIMVPVSCPQPDKGLGKVRERVNYMFLVN